MKLFLADLNLFGDTLNAGDVSKWEPASAIIMCISIFYLSILILFGDWIKQAVRGVFSTEFLFLNTKISFVQIQFFGWSNFYGGMFIYLEK